MHSLLARIASFDHEQIAASQTLLKDEVTAGFIREIAEKIKNGSTREDKKEVERVEKEESKPKPPAKK